MARPTCMALPAALAARHRWRAPGCIGNRVYTDLGDDELYVAVPGRDLAKLAGRGRHHRRRPTSRSSDYHRGRRQALSTE